MATKGFVLIVSAGLVLALMFSGCILPREEAPLITSSRSYTITQGHAERFRVTANNGTSTPEYTIFAENVLNRTALFTITPGAISVPLTEGDDRPVNLLGDSAVEIVVTLVNTTGADANIVIHVAGASQVCTNDCQVGEAHRPYPDCSCHAPTPSCPSQCTAGKIQRPYPDCACYTENRTCSDGTLYGQCSANKPQMCSNGIPVNNCTSCGCPTGRSCTASTGACAAATPTPSPSGSATPTATPGGQPTPTPSAGGALAVTTANASTEGALMSRFDAAYRKAQLCTQTEFTNTFTSREQRAPNQNELTIYSGTKNYLPSGVNVSATVNGTAYDVLYSTTGAHGGPALKISVAGGIAGTRQWLDGTTTAGNADLLTTAESITGNCGLIFALNPALN